MQTVIVGEGQQVAVSIGVAKQHIQARDLVYHTQQPRELLEAFHGSAGQRKTSELGVKLEAGEEGERSVRTEPKPLSHYRSEAVK